MSLKKSGSKPLKKKRKEKFGKKTTKKKTRKMPKDTKYYDILEVDPSASEVLENNRNSHKLLE